MSIWQLAIQSLRYYWRTNLAVALGVAAATAVLTGALIVGDSMRSSLLSLTIDRLGAIDELLVSDGFFRAKLAEEIKDQKDWESLANSYSRIAPAILFPGGTVETTARRETARAGSVTVLGITDEFWNLGDEQIRPAKPASGQVAYINQALADDLKVTAAQVAEDSAKITVRIPKQNQLPADSALGKQKDLIESLVDLSVVKIIPNESLGRFGLHPTQSNPLNVYVPIELLQDSLARTVLKHKSDPAQANVLMFAGSGTSPPDEATSQLLLEQIRPTLEDYGLTLKQVKKTFDQATIFDYWSLTSDRMVMNDETAQLVSAAIPAAKPVFTYLANDIRTPELECGVPFSMVASVDFDAAFQPISAVSNQPIRQLGENEIVLNEWAAKDLDAQVGDTLIVTYFEPETTHGDQVERQVELKLVDIAKLTEPIKGFVVPRRGPIELPEFDQPPSLVNDPDLTPEVPGVTDAESIENWDLPFETADRIEPEDDEYWTNHRTTPKAFVSLATGQKLWNSRFGQVTNFRIPIDASNPDDSSLVAENLNRAFSNHKSSLGLHLVPIKRRGLAASSGSTPFDVLFLALSMFVIGSALILVALLFRLGFQQRAAEVGLMSATGFHQSRIRRVWLTEMSLVSLIGAVVGILLGIGYAALMIWGLTTWWVGAISRPFLTLSVSPLSLAIGLISGMLVCVGTIAWSLRKTSQQDVRSLLAGQIEDSNAMKPKSKSASKPWLIYVLIVLAIGLAAMATGLSGEAQAGSFMGSGFLVLTALLMMVYRWLRRPASDDQTESLQLASLAIMNGKRNPLRSTLTIGLVAVASFLIAAVSAFRLAPTEQGTAGFDWVAQSSQPILEDLSTVEGRAESLGSGNELTNGTVVMPLRFKAGEDASCNNLYQSTQPRVLGVPEIFVNYFDDAAPQHSEYDFAWAGSTAETAAEQANPWRLLDGSSRHAGTAADPIPVVIDKNTANYSLKIYTLNSILKVAYDSGETVHFKVVGFLANTILQGSLIIAENDFKTAFPAIGGYQYFLIKDGLNTASMPDGELAEDPTNVSVLERQLGDYGFDARSAPQLLANFMAVQNTYLSTFQTLGALGLLLGTFGLAAVQIRSVMERKKELGLMRAVGFSQARLARMVLLENTFLLLLGLGVGIAAALFTTLPHWFVGSASVPWGELAFMFTVIAVVGLLAGLLGSRLISKMPLLESLRA